jgi:hypothetical protein
MTFALTPDGARRQRARQLIAWAGDHLELTQRLGEHLKGKARVTL